MSAEQEPRIESITLRKLDRTRRVGRNILAIASGMGIFASSTYVGYKIGTDVTGPENDSSNHFMYYAGVALPTVVIGGIGALGGFYTTVGMAADTSPSVKFGLDSSPKPKEQSATSPEPPTVDSASEEVASEQASATSISEKQTPRTTQETTELKSGLEQIVDDGALSKQN